MDKVRIKTLKPIFKNGKTIEPDFEMEMEIDTAFRFSVAGDVEILDNVEIVKEVVTKAVKKNG